MSLILAGKSWIVDKVNEDRRTLNVVPDQSEEIIVWYGKDGLIDQQVTWMIHQILAEIDHYPYLSKIRISF